MSFRRLPPSSPFMSGVRFVSLIQSIWLYPAASWIFFPPPAPSFDCVPAAEGAPSLPSSRRTLAPPAAEVTVALASSPPGLLPSPDMGRSPGRACVEGRARARASFTFSPPTAVRALPRRRDVHFISARRATSHDRLRCHRRQAPARATRVPAPTSTTRRPTPRASRDPSRRRIPRARSRHRRSSHGDEKVNPVVPKRLARPRQPGAGEGVRRRLRGPARVRARPVVRQARARGRQPPSVPARVPRGPRRVTQVQRIVAPRAARRSGTRHPRSARGVAMRQAVLRVRHRAVRAEARRRGQRSRRGDRRRGPRPRRPHPLGRRETPLQMQKRRTANRVLVLSQNRAQLWARASGGPTRAQRPSHGGSHTR
mmetsp:Transcript_1281/g.5687  ORF Transcript_1281/g.5687 Transcript_1281/m.5687 type:complete len:369 (+) Transcript_1281:405-1511(+)